jgi:uncharacterized protein
MEQLDRFSQLHHIYSPKRPTRIIGANLPNGFGKTAEHLRAFVLLADLRLVERETELLANRRRKLSEPVKRIHEPNQLASLRLFRHSTHCMPKLAYPRRKAALNLKKHRLAFEEAASVFLDPSAITFPDPDHSSDELREITISRTKKGHVVFVSHCERAERSRIISARLATPTERKQYEEGTGSQTW